MVDDDTLRSNFFCALFLNTTVYASVRAIIKCLRNCTSDSECFTQLSSDLECFTPLYDQLCSQLYERFKVFYATVQYQCFVVFYATVRVT